MARLGLSYTAEEGTVYNYILDNFGDDSYPRTYVATATFDTSVNGTNILGGPARIQKYTWAIASVVPSANAQGFEAMFRAWDLDRSNGFAAAVGIVDETFGPSITTTAVFVTPPSYTRMGPYYTMISCGLQEI